MFAIASSVQVYASFQYLVLIPGFPLPWSLLLVFVNMRTRVVPMKVKEAVMRLRNKEKKQWLT